MPSQQRSRRGPSKPKTGAAERYTAVIADMVASRAMSPSQRARVQVAFARLIGLLNRLYADHLRAKFVITLGDEFQGLLRNPEVIPQLVWTLERKLPDIAFRLGFGYGRIYTSLKEYAINVDGPALHRARAAIEAAKRHKLRGGVFDGFGSLDAPLNGFARVLQHQRAIWPPRQLEVVRRLHDGKKGVDIARALGITKQAVSRYASLAGWEAYAEAERGWSALLRSLGTGKRT